VTLDGWRVHNLNGVLAHRPCPVQVAPWPHCHLVWPRVEHSAFSWKCRARTTGYESELQTGHESQSARPQVTRRRACNNRLRDRVDAAIHAPGRHDNDPRLALSPSPYLSLALSPSLSISLYLSLSRSIHSLFYPTTSLSNNCPSAFSRRRRDLLLNLPALAHQIPIPKP